LLVSPNLTDQVDYRDDLGESLSVQQLVGDGEQVPDSYMERLACKFTRVAGDGVQVMLYTPNSELAATPN
jgi:hypothetical protein